MPKGHIQNRLGWEANVPNTPRKQGTEPVPGGGRRNRLVISMHRGQCWLSQQWWNGSQWSQETGYQCSQEHADRMKAEGLLGCVSGAIGTMFDVRDYRPGREREGVEWARLQSQIREMRAQLLEMREDSESNER